MNDHNKSNFNHIFFRTGIEIFRDDIDKFRNSMELLPADILMELITNLIALKEVIESLEVEYKTLSNLSYPYKT